MNVSSDRLLRRTLWGNAAFSVVSGAVLAAFAGPFARVTDLLKAEAGDAIVRERVGGVAAVLGILATVGACRRPDAHGVSALSHAGVVERDVARQRGRVQGLFGAVWGVSGIAGPIVGGLLALVVRIQIAWPAHAFSVVSKVLPLVAARQPPPMNSDFAKSLAAIQASASFRASGAGA
mgnify:CR=1 FL=1